MWSRNIGDFTSSDKKCSQNPVPSLSSFLNFSSTCTNTQVFRSNSENIDTGQEQLKPANKVNEMQTFICCGMDWAKRIEIIPLPSCKERIKKAYCERHHQRCDDLCVLRNVKTKDHELEIYLFTEMTSKRLLKSLSIKEAYLCKQCEEEIWYWASSICKSFQNETWLSSYGARQNPLGLQSQCLFAVPRCSTHPYKRAGRSARNTASCLKKKEKENKKKPQSSFDSSSIRHY